METALRIGGATITYAAHSHLPPGTLRDAGVALGTAATSTEKFKATLDQIAAAEDPYGAAIASAFCTGLGNLVANKDPSRPEPTQQDWADFLIDQAKEALPATL